MISAFVVTGVIAIFATIKLCMCDSGRRSADLGRLRMLNYNGLDGAVDDYLDYYQGNYHLTMTHDEYFSRAKRSNDRNTVSTWVEPSLSCYCFKVKYGNEISFV